jgi:hypothetical protein
MSYKLKRTITGTADFLDVSDGLGASSNPTLSIATEFEETGMHGWNGSLLETAAVSVTSDGATATFNIEKSGGGDLTVVFSDGYFDWDTSPADTVSLTAGTDTAPQINFVYFLQSTKALAVSTTSFPAAEHAPLATVFCQSAASVQTDGVMKLHAWTDHVVKTSQQGHINDLNYWIRQQPATYVDGVLQTFNINAAATPDEVTIATASGTVLQLHPQTYPAFSAADDYYVVNDSVTPNLKVTDLNAISADSTGATLSNRYYSLVLWGVVSQNASDSKRFINLPSGSYNSQTGVEEDLSGFANYTIPAEYTGTGFLIAEWKLRQQAAGGGTFTSIDEIDLRGLLPAINAGGGVISGTEFADNTFRVFDDLDDTKKLSFQVSGVSPATTRELTIPDADGTIMISSAGDSGTATPDSNGQMTFSGGTGLTSSAASNTVTIDLDSPVAVANGGTGLTTITDAAILVGDGTNAIEPIGPLTNGQLLVGSTGLSPVAASLTQPAAGLTITGGAGSITFALADSLAALEGLTGNGVVVKTGADTFTERTITGTGSRITVTNGNGVSGNPTIDISASYVGQASITTLGTITTGTWNGTAISETNGGTNQTTYTTGDILYASGANTLSKLAIGSSTQVLTVTGGVPVWAAASGGGGNFVFISSTTISSDATVEFTGLSSTYSAYFFVLDAVAPASDNVLPWLRVSTDNGSTWKSGASDYAFDTRDQSNIGTSAANSEIRLSPNGQGNASNETLNGHVYVINPSNTQYTNIIGSIYMMNNGGDNFYAITGGKYLSTTAVDGVQFLFESGNLASGKISMYGIEAS